MLLADLARTSREVAATSARSRKTALLAELFRATEPAEAPMVITYLAGRLPQGRLGVGWSVLAEPVPAAPTASLTVHQVDAALTGLAAVRGTGAQAERRRLLVTLLGAATEPEQEFLIRLIGGEVRQGALDALAVDALAAASEAPAEQVRRAVMLGGTLGAVARALLAEGPDALARFRLTVGRPVLPMLAHTAKSVEEALDRLGPCAVEEKLDGIRIQVHRDGGTVRIFTRTLEEITDRLPEVVAAALALPAERAVLDGEVIAVDPTTGRPRPFQEIAGRVGSRLDVPGATESLPLSPPSSTCSRWTAGSCWNCPPRTGMPSWTGWCRRRFGCAGWWWPTPPTRPRGRRPPRSPRPRWPAARRAWWSRRSTPPTRPGAVAAPG